MLGKLFRQELRTQGRVVTGMYGVLAAATILISVLFYLSKAFQVRALNAVFMIGCVFYGITLIVSAVTIFIYLCFHFYKSMYSEQGYLTHTLPVKTTHILNVKVAVSFGYLFLTAVLCILSFLIIGIVMDGISAADIVNVFYNSVNDLSEAMNLPVFGVLLFFCGAALLGCLNSLLLFFAGSSIGQLFQRSKGACGIAAGIGLYYCTQILSIVAVLLGYLLYEMVPFMRNTGWMMSGALLLTLIWTAIYYMICRVIVTKHLNLE